MLGEVSCQVVKFVGLRIVLTFSLLYKRHQLRGQSAYNGTDLNSWALSVCPGLACLCLVSQLLCLYYVPSLMLSHVTPRFSSTSSRVANRRQPFDVCF